MRTPNPLDCGVLLSFLPLSLLAALTLITPLKQQDSQPLLNRFNVNPLIINYKFKICWQEELGLNISKLILSFRNEQSGKMYMV